MGLVLSDSYWITVEPSIIIEPFSGSCIILIFYQALRTWLLLFNPFRIIYKIITTKWLNNIFITYPISIRANSYFIVCLFGDLFICLNTNALENIYKCLNNKSNYYKAMFKVNKSPNKQLNSYITIK